MANKARTVEERKVKFGTRVDNIYIYIYIYIYIFTYRRGDGTKF